jgi:hypothetical protein
MERASQAMWEVYASPFPPSDGGESSSSSNSRSRSCSSAGTSSGDSGHLFPGLGDSRRGGKPMHIIVGSSL